MILGNFGLTKAPIQLILQGFQILCKEEKLCRNLAQAFLATVKK
jgi:hypothetical protein